MRLKLLCPARRPGLKPTSVACALIALLLVDASPAAAEARFSNYEIRVIRPRFFSKDNRLETGAGLMTLTNQSFVYSLLAYGSLTWHFSETIAAEIVAGYGSSFDKKDKGLLSDTFAIDTILLRTENVANARVMFTPAYGKMDLSNGEMLYFDSYASVGAGTTGIHYKYDHCKNPSDYPEEVRDRIPDRPAEKTAQYPTFVAGIGQRFFMNKDSSFRVGLDIQRFSYTRKDGACGNENMQGQAFHDNVFLFSGFSKYF